MSIMINADGDEMPDHYEYNIDGDVIDTTHRDNVNCAHEAQSDLMNAHLESMEKFTDPEKAKYQLLFEDKYYIIHKDDFQKIFKRLISKI